MPFFRRIKRKPETIIELAEAKMQVIASLTKHLPTGSSLPMSRVEEIAKKFQVNPEEIAKKLIVQEGYNIYRD